MSRRDLTKDIAIIGLGAVLPPDGAGVPSFARLLESGASAIRDVPDDRWSIGDHFNADKSAPDKTYTQIGGFVVGAPFKSFEFRIPPNAAQAIDNVQKWALLATREALQDAKLLDADFDRTRTAVLFGNSMGGEQVYRTATRVYMNSVPRLMLDLPAFQRLPVAVRDELLSGVEAALKGRLPGITEDSMAGELANCIAGRVAGAFDLRGPSCSVDAACAGSLAAIHAAVHGLRAGTYDTAIVGGVDSNMGAESYVKFCKIGALSPDGSRPFDAGANGFVMGEGGAVFVLKRLEDALRANDHIRAVIRGVGASSDGKGKGITAPNPRGQAQALRAAYQDAGLKPRDVSYVECHGTSTPVGDRVEATVLEALFAEDGVAKGGVAIGSVKSQIGHLKGAAGAAALLKVALGLERGQLYPSINAHNPNPEIFANGTLRLQGAREEWAPSSGLRRAGVSAFGFGGTNYHVLLEQPGAVSLADIDKQRTTVAIAASRAPGAVGRSGPFDVRMVGAASQAELVNRLDALMTGGDDLSVAAAAEHRLCVVTEDPAPLVTFAKRVLPTEDSKQIAGLRLRGVYVGQGRPGKVAFVFPGQGSQYPGMLKDLYDTVPEVKSTFDEADRVMTPLLGGPLTDLVFGDDAEVLKRTEVTQPALLTADVAIMRTLQASGIEPDGAIGHSLGEYAALVCAGALAFEDALLAVSARGREMAKVSVADAGLMASVFAPMHVIERVIGPINQAGGYVACANKNSRSQTVIAGATESVRQACAQLAALEVRVVELPVSHAFHTRIVEPAVEPLKAVLRRLPRCAPRLPVYRNLDGALYPMGPGAEDELVDILGRQVGGAVEFVHSLERMWADGYTHFVEVGPGRVLTSFVNDVLGERGAFCVPTNVKKKAGGLSLSAAVGALKAAGVRPSEPVQGRTGPRVVITGVSVGLPSVDRGVFHPDNLEALFGGESFISPLPPSDVSNMVDQNVVRVKKDKSGGGSFELLDSTDEVVQLVGRADAPDMNDEFGIDAGFVKTFDVTTKLGVAAGLEALRDAYLPLVRTWRTTTTGSRLPTGWALPSEVGDETGVVFASSFSGIAELVSEVNKKSEQAGDYRYPRNFLLRTIVHTNQQLAQLLKARGPNVKVDSACSSTTTALAVAEDWIRSGRCRRVVVIGADDITHSEMAEWYVTGFLAAGAATNARKVEDAALPFDKRRHGMIVGMGAVAMVVESAESAAERGVIPIAELVCTEVANSAYHGTRLDREHVSSVMRRLVATAAERLGIEPAELGKNALFMSHETHTPARGGSAQAEVDALRASFGSASSEILVTNTKGFTGHSMAAGIEDGVVLKALQYGKVPPIANLTDPDPDLMPLNLSPGGSHQRKYAVRLAAGFGSHIGMAVFEKKAHGDQRVDDSTYRAWLSRVSGRARPQLEVEHKTLRVMEADLPDGAEWRVPDGPHNISLPEPTGPAALPEPLAPELSYDDVVAEVMSMAAKRTRLPVEMLEPDLDMEADLGIDTVMQAELMSEVRVRFALGAADDLRLKDYPTLRAAAHYVWLCRGMVVPAEYAGSTGSPGVDTSPEPASGDLPPQVIALVSARTGYPAEMLELDLDMEADLGIDTVKQAELMAELRERFDLPANQELQLKDYPTLRHVIGYVQSNAAAVTAAPPAPVVAAETVQNTGPVPDQVVALVSARTGYPAEMLELDLDMEADLGIDTVKQAELMAELRERFNLPANQELQLKDYPTLRHVIGYVQSKAPTATTGPTRAPATAPALNAPGTAGPTPAVDVTVQVVELVSARTGYPAEMLELDLDMEADLGIDTVKQAELMAELRERFGLPDNKELQLKDYPTLRLVAGYVQANLGTPAAVTSAVPSAAAADLTEQVVQLVSARTGYPAEMLELDLDMEADLGIDTVKQAELMAGLRERFGLPENKELQLKDYPTLRLVVGYVQANTGAASIQPTPVEPPSTPASTPPAPTPAAPTPAAPVSDLTSAVVEMVSARTGYPVEMLELDLDMEADLGIDTVKQAELMAELRERFGLPENKELQLKDYPTLRLVAGYVQANASGASASAVIPPEATPPAPIAAVSVPVADLTEAVVAIVSARTGYPAEMLELDLDMEADLGIDTVKQAELMAELRERFGLPGNTELQLKDYPTLRHVAGYVQSNAGGAAAPTPAAAIIIPEVVVAPPTPPRAEPVPESAPLVDFAQTVDPAERVRRAIADACGLPIESLTEHVRPATDLGLDLDELFGGFGLAPDASLKDIVAAICADEPAHAPAARPERHTAPTLPSATLPSGGSGAALAERVAQNTLPYSDDAAFLARDEAPRGTLPYSDDAAFLVREAFPVEPAVSLDGVVARRLTWRLRGAGEPYGATGCEPRRGQRVVVVAPPGELGDAVANELRGHGVQIDLLPIPSGPLSLDKADGLIYLDGGAQGLFRAVKALESLAEGGFVLAAGGRELAGFCKSLRKEWPNAGLVKAVVWDEDLGAPARAKLALDELAFDAAPPVVRFAGAGRWVEGLEAVSLEGGPAVRAPHDVWVVTGGARGITAEIVRQIARTRGGVFHLLGRTVLTEPLPAPLPTDEAQARRLVLAELSKGGKVAPTAVLAEVKRRRGVREIADFVSELRGLSDVHAQYHSVDVGNAAVLSHTLAPLAQVDWLVHAAGIEVSRTLDRKSDQEFARVLGPKLSGFDNLIGAVGNKPLANVITFGSVSGRFGNAGQADYAAANEGMSARLTELAATRVGLRGLQIDWTAWSGAGMATRGSVTQMLEAAGIGFLPLDPGALAFRRLAFSDVRGEVVVDCGLGQMEPEVLKAFVPTPPAFLGGQSGRASVDDRTVRFSWTLDPKASWLDDHRIEGVPVLPGVMGLEGFAQAARTLVPGARTAGFEAVQFYRPLKLNGDRPVEAAIEVQPEVGGESGIVRLRCRLLSRFTGKNGPQGPEREHFRAVVVLSGHRSSAQPIRPNGQPMNGGDMTAESIYGRLFHGQSFQVLDAAERYGEGLRARVNAGRLELPTIDMASAPMALEALFQAVGLHQVLEEGAMGLPSSAARVALYGHPAPGRAVECAVSRSDDGGFDALLRDEKGRVFVELHGYRTSLMS